MHPKINGGELYIAYFKDCVIDGQLTDGVGIFKSETKETYLRVFLQGMILKLIVILVLILINWTRDV